GGTSGAVFNAANEVVVESFLEQSLPFESMVSIVEKVLGNLRCIDCSSIDSIIEADNEARELAKEYISSVKTRT
ncbi:MAG TPA: 1-deoxy-D-xylulose-5-phosphate reductoisomerase, partial [Opitutae bacterium]|nr:1-deoxy-D-xylulose-5-phosphate reductoisomerase [Opitutae bacterium]